MNIFCKVIELKSFSKAGGAIHLSQPTVSSHIKDLEEHFGCRLIDRLGKEALPTRAGDLLYGYAKRLLALRDETETALSHFKGKTRGHIVIGGSTIPGGYILPRIMGDFIKKYPEVKVSLVIGDTGQIFRNILDGSVEIAVTGARSDDKNIHQDLFMEDDMRLIVHGEHKWKNRRSVTLEMLAGEPFITREKGSGTLKSLRLCMAEAGFDLDNLNVIAHMGNTVAVCQGIKSRIGVSILSTKAVAEELKTGQLAALTIQGINLKRNFYITTHKKRTPSPLCLSFGEFLKNSV